MPHLSQTDVVLNQMISVMDGKDVEKIETRSERNWKLGNNKPIFCAE